MRIAIVALGCDKNTVDCEYLAGILEQRGHQVKSPQSPLPTDIVLILTCGFIEEAKQESINTILQWAAFKNQQGSRYRLIVAGCLPQLYTRQLSKAMPEVDAFVGVCALEKIISVIESSRISRQLLRRQTFARDYNLRKYYPRKLLSGLPYSFLKIADGCDHSCSFCVIPKMKGKFRSVPRKILLREAEGLIGNGIKELNLIAQDITSYGKDLYKNYGLAELLQDLCELKGRFWIRLLYLFPTRVNSNLIHTIANQKKVCRYLDIPIQHLDETVLSRMRRPHQVSRLLKLISRLRAEIPNVILRTTVVVGFPGEGRKEFNWLLRGLQQLKFERLGAFQFSAEPRAPASHLSHPVSSQTKKRRWQKIMQLQAQVTHQFNLAQVGKEKTVLIESRIPKTNIYLSRSESEAPEVDSYIIVSSGKQLEIGSFSRVKVTAADTYDLKAVPL